MGREEFLEGLSISDARIEVVEPPELPEKGEQAVMESAAPPTLPPIEIEEEMLDEQVSELKGQVKELTVKVGQLDEIITADKEKQEDQAEIEGKCPNCGKPGFANSTPKQFGLGPRYLECSWCGHKKQIKPGLFTFLEEE